MKRVLLLSLLLIASSCSLKNAKKALQSGNYDETINVSIKNLVGDKDAKRKQDYVFLLRDAYQKAREQDKNTLKRLQASSNPESLESIYETYLRLQSRQDRLVPLLPLRDLKKNKEIVFEKEDYTQRIENARGKLSEYLLVKSRSSLANASKLQARDIYDDLRYLNDINPNYSDVSSLLDEAFEKGLDYVQVSLVNNTDKVIPVRLQNELLNFSTYGINKPWIVFHTEPEDTRNYDYDLSLQFQDIIISPDQVFQKELQKEKNIKDGFEYVYDRNGNVAKDSLGNDIKKDKMVLVKAVVLQSEQFKDVTVTSVVEIKNLKTRQLVDRFPLNSTYTFNYLFATVRGDRRALDANYLRTLNPVAVPFPTTEQMIYDAGEDLKGQLKSILNRIKL
ncbi:MAG: hypothetical protein NWQ19_00295 [Nonlabens sp.]|nr:hypothetical protein [Nonlabens sp.]